MQLNFHSELLVAYKSTVEPSGRLRSPLNFEFVGWNSHSPLCKLLPCLTPGQDSAEESFQRGRSRWSSFFASFVISLRNWRVPIGWRSFYSFHSVLEINFQALIFGRWSLCLFYLWIFIHHKTTNIHFSLLAFSVLPWSSLATRLSIVPVHGIKMMWPQRLCCFQPPAVIWLRGSWSLISLLHP